MIVFLESNPKFQDISDVHIWFRIAEECLRIKKRIKMSFLETEIFKFVFSKTLSQKI